MAVGDPDGVLDAARRNPDVRSREVRVMLGDAWMRKDRPERAVQAYGEALRRRFSPDVLAKYREARK